MIEKIIRKTLDQFAEPIVRSKRQQKQTDWEAHIFIEKVIPQRQEYFKLYYEMKKAERKYEVDGSV